MSTVSEPVKTEARAPWHRGEIAIQHSIGAAGRMNELGKRVVRDYMPDQHRQFFEQLPFMIAGAVDADGNPWATLLAGRPGFMHTPDAVTLDIAVACDPLDPADAGMNDGDAIGLLGIELHTRRRNRMNGVIRRERANTMRISVEQSYGNCPQYIQLRDFAFVRNPSLPPAATPVRFDTLTPRIKGIVDHADTFFVATYFDREDEHRQTDVSHRGGKSSFVRVGDDGTFTVPDFAGNSFFNTLGNILVNGRAGLLFADFETGDVLQLSGDAEVLLDSPETAVFQGAERLWRFTPRRIVLREGALPLRWTFRDEGWSPNSLMTGD